MEDRSKTGELPYFGQRTRPAMREMTRANRGLSDLRKEPVSKARAKEQNTPVASSLQQPPSSAPASWLNDSSSSLSYREASFKKSEYLIKRGTTAPSHNHQSGEALIYNGRLPSTAQTTETMDTYCTSYSLEEAVIQPPIVYRDVAKDSTNRSKYSVDKSFNLRSKSGVRVGLPRGYSDRRYLEELEKIAEHQMDVKASQFLRRYKKIRRQCEEGYFDDFDNFGDGAMFVDEEYEEDPVVQVPAVKPWKATGSKYKRISKGKRLWLRALRLIKLGKAKNAPVSRPPECKADVSFDKHGNEQLVLTTMPENEDRVQVERKAALLMLRKSSSKRAKLLRPSVTMEDALRWYTNKELQRDDQICRAMENAALRKLRKAEEAAELRLWLAKPNPSIEVKNLTAEALSLETKLAFSIGKIRETVKALYPCSIVRSSADTQFVEWWSTGALEPARQLFLELEIDCAAQDPAVRVKASESGVDFVLADKSSMKREERQRWRDFCAWYFQKTPLVRVQFLQEHSRQLDSYLESSWFRMKKELERLPDVRTSQEMKKLRRKRHKTVVEVVDSVVEDLTELPHRLKLEAFKPPPEELLLENELHSEFGDAALWTSLDDESKTLELKMALRSRIGRYYVSREGFNIEELLTCSPLIWKVYSAWYGGHSKLRRHLLRREIVSLVQSPSPTRKGDLSATTFSLLEDMRPLAIKKLQDSWNSMDDGATDLGCEECKYNSYLSKREHSMCVLLSHEEAIEMSEKLLQAVKIEVQRSVDALLFQRLRENQGVWRRYGFKYATDDFEEVESIEVAEACAVQELEDLLGEGLLELLSLTAKLQFLWTTLVEMLEVLRLLQQAQFKEEAPREFVEARARLARFSSENLQLLSKVVERGGISALDRIVCGFHLLKERLRKDVKSALFGDVSHLRCLCCTSSVVRDLNSIGITCSAAEFSRLSEYSLVLTKACATVPSQAIYPFQTLDYELMRESKWLPQLVSLYMNNLVFRREMLSGLTRRHERFLLEQNEKGEETEGVCVLDPVASTLSPPVDKWAMRKLRLEKILLWYSPEELEADDREMERAELMGRMYFEQELLARMNRPESGIESGSEETETSSSSESSDGSESGSSYVFTSPIDTENNLEYSVTAVLQMAAEIEDTASAESAEEAEKRRRAELKAMRREERSIRRWIAETRRRKLMQDTELALNREVERQKQDEQERRNDRDGMTVAEREAYENMCMAKEDAECQQRWILIDEDTKRRLEWEVYIMELSHRRMMEEDNNSYLWSEAKREETAIEASRAVFERALMESEDIHSYLCRPLWNRERQQTVVWNSLMSAAYAPFKPYYSSPKTDTEIFAGLESSSLEFHPRGSVPEKRDVDIHLSNKFQQVLGIPSNFRIPPLGKKVEKPRLHRSKTLSRMKLSSMHWQDSRDEGRGLKRPSRVLASAPIRMPTSQGSTEHGSIFPSSRKQAR